MYAYRKLIFVLMATWLLGACMPSPFYQANEPIPHNAWEYNYKPTFTFDITDTTAVYRTSFIIRHTQAYPYNNIWMWMRVKTPGDSVAKKFRVNVVLSEPSGKWLGRGMGEIYEQHMTVAMPDSVNYNKPGTYSIQLEQNMRINPLPDVLHVGVRVEKVTVKR